MSRANFHPLCNRELVHVGKARKQNRRDVSVNQQEQKGVAGVVFVVVGRRVITAGAGLTLNTSAGVPVRTVLTLGALRQPGERQGSRVC